VPDLVEAGYLEAWRAGWEPEPRLTVSEWADLHRVLTSRSSKEPGRWRTARVPYMREPMDALSPSHPAQRVVIVAGAQIAKSETGNNWLGFVIHHAPGPMMLVFPTIDDARKESKQRIGPMFEECEVLKGLIASPRSRDSGNTILVKEFPGGILVMVGANTAAGLRGRPIRFLFCDEVDQYPGDIDGQGDPVALAEARTATFSSRRKILLTSTPKEKGLSRIDREWLRSDRRRYFVPCPKCGTFDWVRWHNLRWERGRPETVRLVCETCQEMISESAKPFMLEHGQWRPTSQGDGVTWGYHVPSLLSPIGWKSWVECVTEWERAQNDPFRLKTFVNTVLGEPWEQRGSSVEAEDFMAEGRRENYGDRVEVPRGVGVLVAAVDVQDKWLEAQVVGYGPMEESWLIAHEQFQGDPGTAEPWWDVDRFLRRRFRHESGRELHVACTVVDSGGHFTEQVYRFCAPRLRRRVFAIKGVGETGRSIVGRPTRGNRYRTTLFPVYVDSAKEMVLARLCIKAPGPGYVHLPTWVDEEYVLQLTSEKAVTKYVRGKGSVKHWERLRQRNEAFDLAVYCLAALRILGESTIRALPELARAAAVPVTVAGEGALPGEGTRPGGRRRARRRTPWVENWR